MMLYYQFINVDFMVLGMNMLYYVLEKSLLERTRKDI